MNRIIADLLSKKLNNVDSNEAIDLPIQDIKINSGIRKIFFKLLEELDIGKRILVVFDKNTYASLAKEIIETIGDSFDLECCNLSDISSERKVLPDEVSLNLVKERATNCDFILAVGSGTINDICKYISFLLDKKYVIFATAPSMNGYISSSSSLVIDNQRISISAHLPYAAYFDLDILKKAPLRLIKSGLGDLICRSTARADWILSHYVKKTDFLKTSFFLLQGLEEEMLKCDGFLERKESAIRLLTESLVISGVGMCIAGGSYPASQGEHVIAHYLEMHYPEICKDLFHGEEIAVTSFYMAKLQEDFLKKDLPIENWQEIKKEIKKDFIGSETIKEFLQKNKIAFLPSKLGIDEEIFSLAAKNAHKVRDRFGFLNLQNY